MKALLSLGLLLLGGGAVPALSREVVSGKSCIPIANVISPAEFGRHPVDVVARGPWRKPNVRRGMGHLYRTVLSREGSAPPNFAGHYKVVTHGCGAGMTCPLFIDLKTGKVTFAAAIASVEHLYDLPDVAGIDDVRLVCRADSRLLVAVGTRNEDLRLTGATLFEWREGGLQVIRFIPKDALCLDTAGGGHAS